MKKKRKDFIHNFSPAFLLILCLATGLSGLTACSKADAPKDTGNESQKSADTDADQKKKDKQSKKDKAEILHFVDVYQNPYQVEINPEVKKHDYKDDSFVHNGHLLTYEGDDNYTSRLGVDVSEHQGYVDWQTLKDNGFSPPWLPRLRTGRKNMSGQRISQEHPECTGRRF